MQTAREYLMDLGLVKSNRGKLSYEAKFALKKALRSGIEFSDWDENGRIKPIAAPKRKPKKTEYVTVESENQQERDVLAADPVRINCKRREENAIEYIDADGVHGVMDICNNNHYIQHCVCIKPKPKNFLNAKDFKLIVRK